MSRLETFVKPKPKRWVRQLSGWANRFLILPHISKVKSIDFPDTDRQLIKDHVRLRTSTFLTPNHPKFFHDWMLDERVISWCAPNAASWAINYVVNGGMQKFWLANNLIAMIAGKTEEAIAHSVAWANKGNAVLLHAEGKVGWHADHIAELRPGAMTMALQSLETSDVDEAYVVPLVWTFAFTKDMTAKLMLEYRFICTQLGIRGSDTVSDPAEGVFHIYKSLMYNELMRWNTKSIDAALYREGKLQLVGHLVEMLEGITGAAKHSSVHNVQKHAAAWLGDEAHKTHPERRAVTAALRSIKVHQNLGAFAFQKSMITQEDVEGHLKRLRADAIGKGLFNTMLPIPCGPSKAYIRACKPIAVHDLVAHGVNASVVGTKLLRESMQERLDLLHNEVHKIHPPVLFKNPFYHEAGYA